MKGTGGPLRTTEKYSESGSTTLYERNVEVLGPDGYRPSFEIEIETIRVDATTTRSLQRSYSPDGNGRKQLTQVTEEDTKLLPNGDSAVVRTTSKPTPEGDLRIVECEFVETRSGGPESQDTLRTVYGIGGGGNVSGNPAPVRQTHEELSGGDNGQIETTKTTKLVDDGNGRLQLAEINEKVVRKDGENRTTEERISVPNSEGNLAEVSRTVVKETQSHSQFSETVEAYSIDVPGRSRDGKLHLIQRVTTVRSGDSSRTTTEQQIEQIDPVGQDLKVMIKTADVVTSGPAGTDETKTIRERNPDGTFSIISFESGKSDQASGIGLQASPSNQPH